MSLQHLIPGEKETRPDHDKENDDCVKGSLCRGDACDFLCEIEAIDGQVQCGENPIPGALRFLGFVSHGRKARGVRTVRGALIKMESHLVQLVPYGEGSDRTRRCRD